MDTTLTIAGSASYPEVVKIVGALVRSGLTVSDSDSWTWPSSPSENWVITAW